MTHRETSTADRRHDSIGAEEEGINIESNMAVRDPISHQIFQWSRECDEADDGGDGDNMEKSQASPEEKFLQVQAVRIVNVQRCGKDGNEPIAAMFDMYLKPFVTIMFDVGRCMEVLCRHC